MRQKPGNSDWSHVIWMALQASTRLTKNWTETRGSWKEKMNKIEGRFFLNWSLILKALKTVSNNFITLEKRRASWKVLQQQEISDRTEQGRNLCHCGLKQTHAEDLRSEVLNLETKISAQYRVKIESLHQMTSPCLIRMQQSSICYFERYKSQTFCHEGMPIANVVVQKKTARRFVGSRPDLTSRFGTNKPSHVLYNILTWYCLIGCKNMIGYSESIKISKTKDHSQKM